MRQTPRREPLGLEPKCFRSAGFTSPHLEQAFVDGPTEELCRMVDDYQIYQDRDLSPALWDFIKKNVPSWFANHPTLCYRKSAVLSVGNYNVYDNTIKFIQEDYDLELRLVKKYKKLE